MLTRLIKRGVLLLLSVLALTACGPSSPKLNPLADDAIILAFGDSLTYGKGVAQAYSYPAVLGDISGVYVVNDGVSGETSAQGLARLAASLARYQPDLVLLAYGGNDVLQNVPEQETAANIESMIQIIQAKNAQAVLIAMPKKSLLSANLPLYDSLAEKYQLPIEDKVINTLLRDQDYKSDRVHFNAQGYRKMAEAMHKLLQKHGALN